MVKAFSYVTVFLLLTAFSAKMEIEDIQNVINTDGYYYGTYTEELVDNNFFDNIGVFFVKFDNDKFCNVFSVQVMKGKTIEQTIESIIARSSVRRKGRGNKENSGYYSLTRPNHVEIAYLIFNSPNHLFGKYIYKKYDAIVISGNEIQLRAGDKKIDLKFVRDNVVFKNYLRN